MVEPHEIDTPKKLKSWLQSLPQGTPEEEERARQVALTIAFRIAARLFPIARLSVTPAQNVRIKSDVTSLTAFRALIIGFCGITAARDDIDIDATNASHAAVAAGADSRSLFGLNSATAEAFDAAANVAEGAAIHAMDAAFNRAHGVMQLAGIAAGNDDALRTALHAALAVDLREISDGLAIIDRPLWTVESPLASVWQEAVKELQATPENWSPVIAWYDHLIHPKGRALPLDMLGEIAEIDPQTWDAGSPVALPVIGEIWGRYFQSGAEILNAALVDFTFDQISNLMRAIPMPDEVKVLRDPDRITAIISDAADLIEEMETLCLALDREGTAVQGAGTLRTYFEKVLEELSRARQEGALRVGKLIAWGRILEAALSPNAMLELGPSYAPVSACLEELRALVRNNFATSLARIEPLRDLTLEETRQVPEVLAGLRQILTAALEGDDGGGPSLAPEEVAMLRDLLDSIDLLQVRAVGATTEEARSALVREMNFRIAQVVVTVLLYRKRLGQVADGADALVDELLKRQKQGLGLYGLYELLKKLSGFE